MHSVMGPLILLAILLACGCVTSEEFLRIELNDRLKQRYANDSHDTRLEMDQENVKQPIQKIGESSSHDMSNVIQTELSERAFQKHYELRHRLKFRKPVNGHKGKDAASVESTTVPTTTERVTTSAATKTIEEVPATSPLQEKQELPQEEEFAELMTGTDDDYDIVVFVDKEQLEQESVFSASSVGFFQGIVNFIRWLISHSAEIEIEDYED